MFREVWVFSNPSRWCSVPHAEVVGTVLRVQVRCWPEGEGGCALPGRAGAGRVGWWGLSSPQRKRQATGRGELGPEWSNGWESVRVDRGAEGPRAASVPSERSMAGRSGS